MACNNPDCPNYGQKIISRTYDRDGTLTARQTCPVCGVELKEEGTP